MERNIKVKALQNSPFLVSLQESDVLGKGVYAKVVRAFNKQDMLQEIVVKIINCRDKETATTITNEIGIMKSIPHHENLVNFLKFQVSSENNFYFFMEYCNGGNLEKYMIRNKYLFEEEHLQDFLRQFCSGYKVLLDAHVIHRDIKPQNIMLHNGTFKIADFGFAKFIPQEDMSTNTNISSKGTPLYMSPELFFDRVGSSKVDVFSLGIVLYRMAFKGQHPFYDENKRFRSIRQYGSYVQSCPLRFPNRHNRSKGLVDLLKQMLERDKDKRISWQDIFSHPFMKSVGSPSSEGSQSSKLYSSEKFKNRLNVINASVVKCQKSYEDKQETVKVPAVLMKKDSLIHRKLLKSKQTYTLIEHISRKLAKLSQKELYPSALRSLMRRTAVSGMQYSLNLVEELQNTSGDWSDVSTEDIKSMEDIFHSDRQIMTQFLLKLTDKKRYMPRQYEQLLHDFFTQYADLPADIQKGLVPCLLLLVEVYDFIHKYETPEQPEEEESLESHILEIETMDIKEAEKLLASSLKKRGLLLV